MSVVLTHWIESGRARRRSMLRLRARQLVASESLKSASPSREFPRWNRASAMAPESGGCSASARASSSVATLSQAAQRPALSSPYDCS